MYGANSLWLLGAGGVSLASTASSLTLQASGASPSGAGGELQLRSGAATSLAVGSDFYLSAVSGVSLQGANSLYLSSSGGPVGVSSDSQTLALTGAGGAVLAAPSPSSPLSLFAGAGGYWRAGDSLSFYALNSLSASAAGGSALLEAASGPLSLLGYSSLLLSAGGPQAPGALASTGVLSLTGSTSLLAASPGGPVSVSAGGGGWPSLPSRGG